MCKMVGGVLVSNGTYNMNFILDTDTILVINEKSYTYVKCSLSYVEDLSNYHQYEVIGDFSKIQEYVNNCTDIKLKTQIDATVNKYYNGDYSKLVSYRGEIAKVDGWGTGGVIQYEFSLTVDQLERLDLLRKN